MFANWIINARGEQEAVVVFGGKRMQVLKVPPELPLFSMTANSIFTKKKFKKKKKNKKQKIKFKGANRTPNMKTVEPVVLQVDFTRPAEVFWAESKAAKFKGTSPPSFIYMGWSERKRRRTGRRVERWTDMTGHKASIANKESFKTQA